jgi:hypothetical protein
MFISFSWAGSRALCIKQGSRLPFSTQVLPPLNENSNNVGRLVFSKDQWSSMASTHAEILDMLMYPALPKELLALSDTIQQKKRMHSINMNPIHNFLHSYYQYSIQDISKFSPGLGIGMESYSSSSWVHEKFITVKDNGVGYVDVDRILNTPNGRYGWVNIQRGRDVLRATSTRVPFFGCFGLHEWAMLYSGRNMLATSAAAAAAAAAAAGAANQPSGPLPKHQAGLNLRVSQEVIDEVVDTSCQLKCTHFDAVRFFHPGAKDLNALQLPDRQRDQVRHEQPGCVHANMDLFMYAFKLYPFVPAPLLVDALRLAIDARRVDMRASPYDVSGYAECDPPICVETTEGRRLYVREQQKLAANAVPIRVALLQCYNSVLELKGIV